MTTRGQRASVLVGGGAAIALASFAASTGRSASLGLGDAVLVSTFSLLSLRLLTTSLLRGLPEASVGVRTTLLASFLKLPLLLLGIFYATRLPNPGLSFFLGGVALVYSAFVWFTACSG